MTIRSDAAALHRAEHGGWMRTASLAALASCLLTVEGCAAHTPGANTASVTSGAEQCSALSQQAGTALGEPTARILLAKFNPPSAAKIIPGAPPWMPGTPAMKEHCEIIGVMRERVGSDGQHYAVKFHMRLPTAWNGRFLFQGGGGTNGMLGEAVGNLQVGMPDGLSMGYAVVSTDTGHDNAVNNDSARQGTVAFGHDYQARVEYSEAALDSVATAAKRIVKAYYGRPARYSFFAGCSNGGREGMVFAQRYPDQFDGILAESPAFAVPKAAVAEAWDTQTFSSVASRAGLTQKNGLPDMARAFSNADLAIVANAIGAACDGDDGLVDGMVQDLGRCDASRVRPALDAKMCSGAKADGCLSRDQIEALVRSLGGPHDSQGHALYANWPWDVGVASEGWRVWKLGVPGAIDSINVMLGSPALSGLFVTPPDTVASSSEANMRYQLGFDFDRDAPKIFGRTAEFPRSGWDLVGAQSTDLERFRRHGGKMIVPHGGSDPIFSINDTIAWWRGVDAAQKGKASGFVRVYPVPGMNHCNGGPSNDQFDALAALADWVEKGKAPDRIEAAASLATPWPGRTRPLCPYPAVARYKSGDINRAESFACEAPKS